MKCVFFDDQKVVTLKKSESTYTPRPSITITLLPIFSHLTSSLLRISSSLSLLDPGYNYASARHYSPYIIAFEGPIWSFRLPPSLSDVHGMLRASSPSVAHFPRDVEGCPNLQSEPSLSLLAFDPGSKVLVVLESQLQIVGDLHTFSKVRHLSILHKNEPIDACDA